MFLQLITTWLRAIRIEHAAKNLLVFLPLALLKPWSAAEAGALFTAFVALTLAAGSTYLFNDAHDLDDDRGDPIRRRRPLAAGEISGRHATVVSRLLFISAMVLAASLGAASFLLIVGFSITGRLYTLFARKRRYWDAVAVGVLFGLRAAAGPLAAPSEGWKTLLMLFGASLGVSLTFIKRIAEIRRGMSYKNGYSDQDVTRIAISACSTAVTAGGALLCMVTPPLASSVLVTAVSLSSTVWLLDLLCMAIAGRLRADPVRFALARATSWGLAAVGLVAVILNHDG